MSVTSWLFPGKVTPFNTELSRPREQQYSAIEDEELVATVCSSSRRNHAYNKIQAGTEAGCEQKFSVILLGRKEKATPFIPTAKCSLLLSEVILESWEWFLLTVKC